MHIRVAPLTGRRQFQIVEESLPEPGPGEVQVRVGAVGICGSDLHSYAEGSIGDTPCIYPMVLGHEPAGEVVKADKDGLWLATGDGILSLEEVQLENRKRMSTAEFLKGTRVEKGARL